MTRHSPEGAFGAHDTLPRYTPTRGAEMTPRHPDRPMTDDELERLGEDQRDEVDDDAADERADDAGLC
jgi:hypothetical protein